MMPMGSPTSVIITTAAPTGTMRNAPNPSSAPRVVSPAMAEANCCTRGRASATASRPASSAAPICHVQKRKPHAAPPSSSSSSSIGSW